jgi:hypothetical protein
LRLGAVEYHKLAFRTMQGAFCTMQRSAKIVVLALLAAVGAVATAGPNAHGSQGPSRTVLRCDDASMGVPNVRPAPSEWVIGGRVAIARTIDRSSLEDASGPLRLWTKVGLKVRARAGRVTLAVPPDWRRRIMLAWSAPSSTVQVQSCTSPPLWRAYAGGFYVAKPACIPLVVTVGTRVSRVVIGVGVRCSTR